MTKTCYKVILVAVLSVALLGCVSQSSLVDNGKIYRGMSKRELESLNLLTTQFQHPFSISAGRQYFASGKVEVIHPADASIFFVFEQVTSPSNPTLLAAHAGNGKLHSWHYNFEEAMNTAKSLVTAHNNESYSHNKRSQPPVNTINPSEMSSYNVESFLDEYNKRTGDNSEIDYQPSTNLATDSTGSHPIVTEQHSIPYNQQVAKLNSKITRSNLEKAERIRAELSSASSRGGLTSSGQKDADSADDETNWLSVLMGAAIVGYVVNELEEEDKKTKKKRPKGYDFSKTAGMSSSELGAELLRQKRERGIPGSGYIPNFEQPSIGYNPRVDTVFKTADVQPNSSNFCEYKYGAKTISVSKPTKYSGCPSSIEIPNHPDQEFNLDQMGTSLGVTRLLLNVSDSNYCFYTGGVQIPKAPTGSCKPSIIY